MPDVFQFIKAEIDRNGINGLVVLFIILKSSKDREIWLWKTCSKWWELHYVYFLSRLSDYFLKEFLPFNDKFY